MAYDKKNDAVRKERIEEDRKSRPVKKKSFFFSLIEKLAVLAAIAACLILTVYIQSDIAAKEKKYEQIEQQIEELAVENEELQLTLNSDDIAAYMKQIAVEKYGYAYPDEIRFYDKSHN